MSDSNTKRKKTWHSTSFYRKRQRELESRKRNLNGIISNLNNKRQKQIIDSVKSENHLSSDDEVNFSTDTEVHSVNSEGKCVKMNKYTTRY